MKIVAIAGGIGSGKSVVCKILICLGFDVYDCDSKARSIMDNSSAIKKAIGLNISSEALDENGNLDRRRLSQIVFADALKLAKLNNIVHGAVLEDIRNWISKKADKDYIFIETAILYESGLDRLVDEVWEVYAPENIRIERVCRRNNMDAEAVKLRIEAQRIEMPTPHPHIFRIVNDGFHSLLIQTHDLLNRVLQ